MIRSATACLAALALAACASDDAAPAPDDEALLALGMPNAVVFAPARASAGQPSPEQFDALPATGYRVVVGLRAEDEEGSGWEEARAAELGLEYVRIPVRGAAGVTEENARALEAVLEEHAGEPVLIVCGSGNRVGGLLALRAAVCDGVEPEAALELGRAAGMRGTEPIVRERLGLPPGP